MPKRTNEERLEEEERELVKGAIAETEQEIADSAFDEEPDENTGDTSLEEIDGEDVLDDDELGDEDESEESEEAEGDEEGEGLDELEPEVRQDDRQQDRRGIPPGRLREESEARRAAEAERDAERARVRELDARLRALEQGNKPKPQEREEPDIFADPDAWKAQVRAEIRQEQAQRDMAASFEAAAEEHGEVLHTAYGAFLQACQSGDPVALATGQRIGAAPSRAAHAIMNWHRQQETLREIGNDPDAYIERKLQERLNDPQFRRQAIDGLREDALRGDGGRPRTRTRLPPSLNSSSGGTSHRGGGPRGRDSARTSRSEEQEIFDSAFDD